VAEVIVIRCESCDSLLRQSGREVFIATFLKTALAIGWRDLEDDSIGRTETVTTIKINGLCPDCAAEVEKVLKKLS